jgi:hypothetical protein
MKPKKAKQWRALTARKFPGANEMFIMIYQALKINLWLSFFMMLECIAGPSKKKESRFTTGIGLS